MDELLSLNSADIYNKCLYDSDVVNTCNNDLFWKLKLEHDLPNVKISWRDIYFSFYVKNFKYMSIIHNNRHVGTMVVSPTMTIKNIFNTSKHFVKTNINPRIKINQKSLLGDEVFKNPVYLNSVLPWNVLDNNLSIIYNKPMDKVNINIVNKFKLIIEQKYPEYIFSGLPNKYNNWNEVLNILDLSRNPKQKMELGAKLNLIIRYKINSKNCNRTLLNVGYIINILKNKNNRPIKLTYESFNKSNTNKIGKLQWHGTASKGKWIDTDEVENDKIKNPKFSIKRLKTQDAHINTDPSRVSFFFGLDDKYIPHVGQKLSFQNNPYIYGYPDGSTCHSDKIVKFTVTDIVNENPIISDSDGLSTELVWTKNNNLDPFYIMTDNHWNFLSHIQYIDSIVSYNLSNKNSSKYEIKRFTFDDPKIKI